MAIEFNAENFALVLAKIESCPAEWDQRQWHCGTQHCFAGWAQILAGKAINNEAVRRDARIFLGLTKREADYLFASTRTLEDFKTYNRAGYNRAGYDSAGYDSDGYNRDGYNRDGYDSDGYDSAGYDSDGLDANGQMAN